MTRKVHKILINKMLRKEIKKSNKKGLKTKQIAIKIIMNKFDIK